MVNIAVIISVWAVLAVILIITALIIHSQRKAKQAKLIASANRGYQVWHSGYRHGRAYHHVALFVRNYKYELRRLANGRIGFKSTQYNQNVDFNSFNPELHAQETAERVTQGESEEGFDPNSQIPFGTFGSFGIDLGGNKDGYQILLVGHTDKTHAEIEALGKSLGDAWTYNMLFNNCQTFTKMVAESIVNAYGRTPMWKVAFSESNGSRRGAGNGHAGAIGGAVAGSSGAGGGGGGGGGG